MSKIDKSKFVEISAKIARVGKAMRDADDATFEALAVHLDELIREQQRAMGLSEDEIAKIERESEAAVDAQILLDMAPLKGS
jgi:hypothetical protein